MHKKQKTLSCIILLIIYSLSIVSGLKAASSATQKSDNAEYAAYTTFLSKLDSSSPSSIIQAKTELLLRFRGKQDESANDAFRAFSKFYSDTIAGLDGGVSSNTHLQEVLSKIADVTHLDFNLFPAFDKLDTASAREIKKKYAPALKELHQYTNAGLNFGSAEGMWYLTSDPDFLKEAASVTTGDFKEYLRFNAEECKQRIAEDAGILIPWDELRKKIIREEDFAIQHPSLPEVEKELKGSISWMMNVYLAGIENSSIDNYGVQLTPEVKNSYETYLKENTSSQYYNVVKDVYAIWTKNSFKTSRELVDYLKEKGHGQFTYMLEKGLPKNQSDNDSNLVSRTEGSVIVQAVQAADKTLTSTTEAEETISWTYRLIVIAVSLVLILILLRIRSKRKRKI